MVQILYNYQDRILSDPLLEEIRDAWAMDDQYTVVIKALWEERNKGWVQNSSDNPCTDYMDVWNHLGIVDNKDATLLTLDIKYTMLNC